MTDRALDDLARRVLLDVYDQEYGDAIEELPEHDFSPAFEKKMKKLIRRADHPIRYRVVQAAACLLLAALLSGCTALAISPEIRAAFVGWMREVYETWFVYRYIGEEQPTSEDTVYFPAWVPEGYEEIVSPQTGTFVRTQYENSAKELLTVSYVKGTETSSLSVEWAGAVVRQTSVGHLPADLYLNPDGGPNILVWTDTERDVAFWITAPLSEKELIRIAESIQESDPIPKRYRMSLVPMNYGAYTDISIVDEDGHGRAVYENDQGFSITFGYSNDVAYVPRPETKSSTVYVWGTEAKLYPASEDDGDKTLIWMADDGTTLWVCSPLPDDEMLYIANNVIVHLNRFTDLMDLQLDKLDVTGPLFEVVEKSLTDSFVTQIEDCAKLDAQTGNYMSEEYNKLWKEQMAQYISPDREEVMARVSALADALRQEGRYGETIVSLFGPFYTASIQVRKYDYDFLAAYDLLEDCFDTIAQIVDERNVLIAGYQVKYIDGSGLSIIDPTAEEMQFQYVARQIYMKAYQAAQAKMSQE